MQIGIDSFVAAVPDTLTGENLGPADPVGPTRKAGWHPLFEAAPSLL
jgi:hypothetical protein